MRCVPMAGLLLAIHACLAASAPADPVKIDSGLLEGAEEGGVLAFKGIPFAAAPVAQLRWKAPQPAAAWSGVRKADVFGPVCPQHGTYPPESAPEPMSEDCLYLNLWIPSGKATTPLPVMVWIYGGALENGSSSTPLYSGEALAKRGVILVTFNYRLGVLGFLSLPALDKESDDGVSGNYGLLDQLAALQWVHRNIAAFGGDPGRVTIFGQSSGSISVSALVASPLAKGLFQRAIGESGGLFEPIELAAEFWPPGAAQEGERFAQRSGAVTLPHLCEMSATDLLKTPFNAHFVIDGFALTKSPFDAYRAGVQNDVDLLVGTNAEEGQLFFMKRRITLANFHQELADDFSAPLVWLMNPKPGHSDAEARAAAADFEGDMRFRWDMWTWARLAAGSGSRQIYFYRFSRAPPFVEGDRYFGLGATHGMEMPYVFDHLDQQAFAWTSLDRTLALTVADYWVNFAKTSNPNGAGLPHWPDFKSSPLQVMYLGDTIEAQPIPNLRQLKKIDRIYAATRFASRDRYVILGLLVIAVIAALTAAVLAYRRRCRRRSASGRGLESVAVGSRQ